MNDELDAGERTQVEQSLTSCQKCQQLFTDITHLRHALGTLSQPESLPTSEHVHSHSPQVVQAIMAGIEQREESRNHFTADYKRQAQTFPRVPRIPITTRKRIRPMSLGIGAAVLSLILLVSFLITLPPTSRKGPMSVPGFIPWTIQKQHLLVQNSTGVFALKEIEIITGKECNFYYVFQSSLQGTIHVTAISSLNAAQAHPITLSATVLPLGTIDNFDVGVIRVQYLDRVGQTITLNITSPSEKSVNWQLTPIEQPIADTHSNGGAFYELAVDQHLFPQIIWFGPSSGIAFFKNRAGTHYIFLQVDYFGKIEVITRQKCIQLVGKQGCQ